MLLSRFLVTVFLYSASFTEKKFIGSSRNEQKLRTYLATAIYSYTPSNSQELNAIHTILLKTGVEGIINVISRCDLAFPPDRHH